MDINYVLEVKDRNDIVKILANEPLFEQLEAENYKFFYSKNDIFGFWKLEIIKKNKEYFTKNEQIIVKEYLKKFELESIFTEKNEILIEFNGKNDILPYVHDKDYHYITKSYKTITFVRMVALSISALLDEYWLEKPELYNEKYANDLLEDNNYE